LITRRWWKVGEETGVKRRDARIRKGAKEVVQGLIFLGLYVEK
jgi:hypothetical protein